MSEWETCGNSEQHRPKERNDKKCGSNVIDTTNDKILTSVAEEPSKRVQNKDLDISNQLLLLNVLGETGSAQTDCEAFERKSAERVQSTFSCLEFRQYSERDSSIVAAGSCEKSSPQLMSCGLSYEGHLSQKGPGVRDELVGSVYQADELAVGGSAVNPFEDVMVSSTCGSATEGNFESPETKSKQLYCTDEVAECSGVDENSMLCLLPEFGDPRNPPQPPRAPQRDGEVPMRPPFPGVQVANFKHAHSQSLYEYCSAQRCCILKGLCNAIKIRLEVFSTATLRKTCGEYNMEIRVQTKSVSSKTKSAGSQGKVWNIQSRPSTMTIDEYAKYQALSFLKATKPAESLRLSRSSTRKDNIHFGTNVDLSNHNIWGEQLAELEKLPNFLKVHAKECNMLNHIGHNVLGVNTVQLYMKVPGCKTPGHQENNNFSAVNINVGPGSCEWFSVSEEYWGVIHSLCKKNGVNYNSGSWWPDTKDLEANNIPVYHVLQEPGDIIWIGPGTIHWVQAMGWCNNVAWNVGPMSEWQIKSAIERYEYNRLQPPYKSIVPIIQVSWNLTKYFIRSDGPLLVNIKFADHLFKVVSASLRQCREVLLRVQRIGKKTTRQERLPEDLAHYCELCLSEVFNVIFACKNLVYCYHCALNKSSSLKDFFILEEYELEELQNVVDEFATKIVKSFK